MENTNEAKEAEVENKPCKACGSTETLPQYEGTFTWKGWQCMICGYVTEPEPSEPEPGPEHRIRIKNWRPAWYEEKAIGK